MFELIAATTNSHKAAELSRHFAKGGIAVRPLPSASIPTVEESGGTLAENAALKAMTYALWLQKWVVADDTGLEVDALEGAPGVRSARFAGDQASMAENMELLLHRLSHVPLSQRTARFVCELALAAPDGSLQGTARGCCHGRILNTARGRGGFGYDGLFELQEYRKTLAEFGPAATDCLGHRGIASRLLLRTWGTDHLPQF